MMTAYIGLGGNVGVREGCLAAGREAIGQLEAVSVIGVSRTYETRPMGPSTDSFLNQAIAVETSVDPETLLDRLLVIELANGRERSVHRGPRTLDLDLLAMKGGSGKLVVRRSERLTLPHPRMLQRDFVLAPLAELASNLEIRGRTVVQWLDGLATRERTVLRIL